MRLSFELTGARTLAAVHAALLAATMACGRDPKFILEEKPIAEVRHMGFRQDIPDARRGNAVFSRARYSRDGRYLVTSGTEFRVWDPATGALRHSIRGWLDGNDAMVVDGANHILLAHLDETPTQSDTTIRALRIRDLRDGSERGRIPETDAERARPVGVTASGEVVVMRNGNVEVWGADGSGPRLTVPPPARREFCDWGRPSSVTYNDKECFELSPSGRFLAVTVRNPDDHTSNPMPFLLDLARGLVVQINPPFDEGRGGVRGFAFSADERTLAMGLTAGVWFWRQNGEPDYWTEGVRGPFIAGEHQRNRFLTPMAFAAGDTRLVALGDQLQVSTLDVTTGALVGRVAPPFEDWEGALRVSADGSRAITYRFVADILVVIDGTTGNQRGYVCPYFCNRAHNPVEVPFAVSPDGRRIATGGRLGAGIWDTDADTLVVPLHDPSLPALKPR